MIISGDIMDNENLIENVVKDSWKVFRNNYVTLVMATIVALLMMILIIPIPPMIFGLYFVAIQMMNNKKTKITDVFKGFNYFFVSWGIFILGFIAVVIGLALLVIPGILLMILFQYTIAVAIMEKKGVIASLKRSYEIGKKYFVFSIIFCILSAIIGMVGGLTRFGVLLTMPFSILTVCVATKKISK